MSKIIFGFVGEIASGKGTAVEYIKNKYGASSYRFSTLLREILSILKVPENRENLQDISTLVRERFGQDVLTKAMAENISSDKNEIIVVDGIRLKNDIEYLKKLPNFYLINIYADPELRYKRLIGRGENEGEERTTWEEFEESQKNECELQLQEVIQSADIKIDNNGIEEELIEKLENFVQEKLKEVSQETTQEFKIK